jgi:divalent metal cation (Fe/Co/Zn/Cd) transporter
MNKENRASNIGNGILVEWLSTGWMVAEAALAIGAGLAANSLVLVAFGADSVIEIVASSALLYRLYIEKNHSSLDRVERAERAAAWVVGLALIALALYIVGSTVFFLLTHPKVEAAPLGLGVAAASSVLMPILARAKRRIGKRIGSKALEADGSCSMVCAYMSWIVLAGVIATAVMGWWWLDSLAALGLVYFVVHEGIESIEATRTRHYDRTD